MKKTTKVTLAIIAVIAIIAVVTIVLLQISNKKGKSTNDNLSKEMLNVNNAEELQKLVEKIYEGVETFPSITTMTIDLNDKDAVKGATGLATAEKIDAVVVSEPMVSSQAYSMVLVKVKDAKDASEIAKEMNNNVKANKWICVSAEKIYSTSSGNVAFLVMSSEDMAKPVFDNFKKVAKKVGQEFERTFEEPIPEGWE